MYLKQITIHYWNSYKQGMLIALAIFIVALIVNALVLLVPPPVSITRILFNFHYGLAFLLIIFLGMILNRKGIVWDTVSLTLTLVLFSIPLIYKWQAATYNGVMFGGLIPWSDAQDYYSGAHQLMTTGHLSAWATRRPLFGGFLASLLSITSNNLQFSLIILAVINGLTVFLSSRMIQKIHGPFAAATFLGICYWYYCTIAGTIMSEQIGLSFGSIGLAVLIQGIQNNSLSKSAYGIFLLTVALNARAGAFFILPVIALWLGINFKNELGWRKPIAVGITAIAIGMMGNLAMVKAVGFPNSVPFSNYSYTLYGLATGNTGWKQVLTDYPGVREDQVFDLAVQKIRENPSLFFVGILRSYQDYFTKGYGPFSFLRLLNDRRYSGNQLFLILTWLGLVFAVFNHKKGQYGFILAAFLGIVLSISLIPPKDSGLMRIFAATIPFTAYFASTGVAFFEQLLKKSGHADGVSADGWNSLSLLMPFSATLLILCFAGPLLVKIPSQSHKSNQSLSCPPEKEELTFLMSHGSSVYLADDWNIRESYLPDVRLTDFRAGIEAGPDFYPFLTESLLSLGPGHTISIGMYQKAEANNPGSIQRGYLITNGTSLKPGTHQICITPSQDMNLKDTFSITSPKGSYKVKRNYPYFIVTQPSWMELENRMK